MRIQRTGSLLRRGGWSHPSTSDIRLPVRSAYYLIGLEKTADVRRISSFRDWILEESARFKRVFSEPPFQ